MSLRELIVDELIRLRQAKKMATGGSPVLAGFFRSQLQSRQDVEREVEERGTLTQTVSQQILSQKPAPAGIGLPQIPIPKIIEERVTRFKPMPIRNAMAKVLESYGQYIESATPSKPKKAGQESSYEEEGKERLKPYTSPASEYASYRAKIMRHGNVEL